MALAEYFERSRLAAAQVLEGFEEEAFKASLESVVLGIAFGEQAESSIEGRALLDLVVRLAARLYPVVTFRAQGQSGVIRELRDLATRINPNIDIVERDPTVSLSVGAGSSKNPGKNYFVGSNGWDALVGTQGELDVGATSNPLGAGAAACLALANVFRYVFLSSAKTDSPDDISLVFSIPHATDGDPIQAAEPRIALVGLGAIGNGAVWALARAPIAGTIHLVDPEPIELGNLQRYVLAERSDELRPKVSVAAQFLNTDLVAVEHLQRWAEFVEATGYEWDHVLAAVDSAADRQAMQASLPRRVSNAWTQPGDLGLSVHGDFESAACLNCLYLPGHAMKNEDEIVAEALGVRDRLMEIRLLLHLGSGVSRELLEVVSERLEVSLERVLPFEGLPIRELYVRGICGGAVIPAGTAVRRELHVPLAHQSALAGILLASSLLNGAQRTPEGDQVTKVTRINIMRAIGEELTQPTLKDARGICICQDSDYVQVYKAKYSR